MGLNSYLAAVEFAVVTVQELLEGVQTTQIFKEPNQPLLTLHSSSSHIQNYKLELILISINELMGNLSEHINIHFYFALRLPFVM